MQSHSTSKVVLEFRNTEKVYSGPNEIRAVDNISFSLFYGTFTGLIGPSGSGKTTILNLASGLDQPTAGSVILGGEEISKLSMNELCAFRRRNIGFVFQSYNLFPVLTAVENAEFTSLIRGDDPTLARKRALEALSAVGLSDRAHTLPGRLSGGQQQRVAVARALATQPKIVFADEPTANLDSQTAIQLIELFEKINCELGVSFVFSTHDHRLMERVKTKLVIQDGKLQDEKFKDVKLKSIESTVNN